MEEVLENIGMDDIWLEKNEPREEQDGRTVARKEARIESVEKEQRLEEQMLEENEGKRAEQEHRIEKIGNNPTQKGETGKWMVQ